MENRVITILGCTASGKGGAARALAAELGGEIVSVDSMKVYRGMDIGTAKPTPAQRAAIPHHLIDVADPWDAFSAAEFVEQADKAVAAIHARGRPVVAVGGTVLYFKCFYQGLFAGPSADEALRAQIRTRAEREGLEALHAELARVDPEAAARIHRNDLRRIERALEVYRLTGTPISELQRQWDSDAIRRPEWDWRLVGLRRDKDAASRRINERVRRMVAEGLVEEAPANLVGSLRRKATGPPGRRLLRALRPLRRPHGPGRCHRADQDRHPPAGKGAADVAETAGRGRLGRCQRRRKRRIAAAARPATHGIAPPTTKHPGHVPPTAAKAPPVQMWRPKCSGGRLARREDGAGHSRATYVRRGAGRYSCRPTSGEAPDALQLD